MRFLTEVLELPFDRAKSEACRIEHVISEDVLKRLEILVMHFLEALAWKKGLQKQLHELDILGPTHKRHMSIIRVGSLLFGLGASILLLQIVFGLFQ